MTRIATAAAVAVFAAALALGGCESKMGKGAAVGAAGGAAAGAITGGSAATGAAVGAAGGAIVGGAQQNNQPAKRCFDRGVEVACPK